MLHILLFRKFHNSFFNTLHILLLHLVNCTYIIFAFQAVPKWKAANAISNMNWSFGDSNKYNIWLLLLDDNKIKMTRKPVEKQNKNLVGCTGEGKGWKENIWEWSWEAKTGIVSELILWGWLLYLELQQYNFNITHGIVIFTSDYVEFAFISWIYTQVKKDISAFFPYSNTNWKGIKATPYSNWIIGWSSTVSN